MSGDTPPRTSGQVIDDLGADIDPADLEIIQRASGAVLIFIAPGRIPEALVQVVATAGNVRAMERIGMLAAALLAVTGRESNMAGLARALMRDTDQR